MFTSTQRQIVWTIAGALCIASLLATEAAARGPQQQRPARGSLLNHKPAAEPEDQPVPQRGSLLNRKPAVQSPKIQPVPQRGAGGVNPQPRRMHQGYTPAPNPQHGANPVGSLLDWKQRSSIGPGNRAPNTFPQHSGGVTSGYNPNYPGYTPRGQGNRSRPTGSQAPQSAGKQTPKVAPTQAPKPASTPKVVDPDWKKRQQAIAAQRKAWVDHCFEARKSDPANHKRDCNPPMKFESPRTAVVPGTSGYEERLTGAR
ncbi:MAG: hypothetical protein KIT36_07545 [Alphaproteobacteria bacterium]|nr:hypothetical protein [Alphaproteobacteria bacterium]